MDFKAFSIVVSKPIPYLSVCLIRLLKSLSITSCFRVVLEHKNHREKLNISKRNLKSESDYTNIYHFNVLAATNKQNPVVITVCLGISCSVNLKRCNTGTVSQERCRYLKIFTWCFITTFSILSHD